jgi:hypothetical protein
LGKMLRCMSDKFHELLNCNLQEVFGEGDASRRRAAIEELYTEECVFYVPVGIFVGREALDKFAGDLRGTILTSRTGHAASRKRSIMPAAWPVRFGRTARLYRLGRDHRPWQDRCALCVPRFNAVMTRTDVFLCSISMNMAVSPLVVHTRDCVTAVDGSDLSSRPPPASRPARHR